MLRPTFVSPKWYRTCGSYFTCGSAMENDANTDWFKSGPNIPLAKQLLAEGGYDGRPIVMLQATNIPYMSNAATVLAQQMRSAGMKVDLQPMDWANVVQRRASQNPPDQGGWNIFFTSAERPRQQQPLHDGCNWRPTAGRAGSAGRPTRRTSSCARSWIAAETDGGAQGHRGARSRRMPGTSCRTCISASGSSRRRTARTSRVAARGRTAGILERREKGLTA